jgi:hypothetical protein
MLDILLLFGVGAILYGAYRMYLGIALATRDINQVFEDRMNEAFDRVGKKPE